MGAISVKDVARHAGVSIGTVSNAMNHPEKVAPETVGRVRRSIEELGFVRNAAARQLRDGKSKTVGFVLLDVRSQFFADVARGAETRASEDGLSIILGNGDVDPERELAYLDIFEQQRVRGILISPIGDVTPRLVTLRERGMPTVLVDRSSSDPTFSSVTVDDVAGGRMAVEHLISEGRSRIAFVGGPLSTRQVADRLQGAESAVRAHAGVTLEIVLLDSLSVIAGRKAGVDIASRAVLPDAIFAANDLVATGVLHSLMLQNVGVRVPEDIALIGYDDIDFASAAIVPLSSIRQPASLIGHTALEVLLEEIESPSLAPRHIVFQPELVVRRSTSQAASAEA
jgi:LacI family transcriptional regulator